MSDTRRNSSRSVFRTSLVGYMIDTADYLTSQLDLLERYGGERARGHMSDAVESVRAAINEVRRQGNGDTS